MVRRAVRTTVICLALAFACGLAGCSAQGGSAIGVPAESETSGPAFEKPSMATAAYNEAAAVGNDQAKIDVSSVASGYVGAAATADSRLKFVVTAGGISSNYDMPQDGTPIVCPLTGGNGTYTFAIMENTTGNSYVDYVDPVTVDVALSSEFEPFLRPSVYCAFDSSSACVALADELAADAQNEGDVVRGIYTWVVENIDYDVDKASQLENATGYIPDPDQTLQQKSGICFDYASLSAAMLRSQGIPCKIVTGYVSPDNIYHAWNMVYIDGSWISSSLIIEPATWSRIDTTFAASGANGLSGDGTTYTDRYTF